ncbi:MAG: hypothetical protein ACI9XO_005057 [Paraglaciecola sp.]|jgi:hypothetical protein
MVNYEGIGIAPDIDISNKKIDIDQQIDPVIATAIQTFKIP